MGANIPSVINANAMVARSALLILMAMARSLTWVLEQPTSSLMPMHPALEYIKHLAKTKTWSKWYSVTTFLGQFGKDCEKPINLFTNKTWPYALTRPKPATGTRFSRKTWRLDSRGGVEGTKETKGSQSYTTEFGQAVLDAYVVAAPGEEDRDLDHDTDDENVVPAGVWDVADLGSIVKYIHR